LFVSLKCIGWLHDDVFSVRVAAASNLRRLTELLGAEWAVMTVIPQLRSLSNRTDDQFDGNQSNDHNMTSSEVIHPSAHRLASLLALAAMTPALGSALIQQHVVPIALKLCQDPIPNVRFNSAKTLELAIPLVEANVVSADISPCLNNMLQDSDRDVQYFASRAIASLS
jgi:serine/threonine-protein phosphatase 2A regulatory subunit A